MYMKLNTILKLGGKSFQFKKKMPRLQHERQSKSYDKKDQQQIPIMDKELLVLHCAKCIGFSGSGLQCRFTHLYHQLPLNLTTTEKSVCINNHEPNCPT